MSVERFNNLAPVIELLPSMDWEFSENKMEATYICRDILARHAEFISLDGLLIELLVLTKWRIRFLYCICLSRMTNSKKRKKYEVLPPFCTASLKKMWRRKTCATMKGKREEEQFCHQHDNEYKNRDDSSIWWINYHAMLGKILRMTHTIERSLHTSSKSRIQQYGSRMNQIKMEIIGQDENAE